MFDTPSTVRHAQLTLAAGQSLQRLDGTLLLGAGGQRQAVNVDVFIRDTGGVGSGDNALSNRKAALAVGGIPSLSSARPTTAAPYFLQSGRIFSTSPARR